MSTPTRLSPSNFCARSARPATGLFCSINGAISIAARLEWIAPRRPRNADFALNDSRYQGAGVLLARENFGCGSSREHAVWALVEAGFRAVVAPSFGEIFQANAMKNGLLPVVLPTAVVDRLFAAAREEAAEKPLEIEIDLRAQSVRALNVAGENWRFEIEAEPKRRLLEGLDEIALTLRRKEEIVAFEARRRAAEPWAFL